MSTGSRKLLLKLSLVVAMVAFLLSFPTKPATASCTYDGYAGPNCMVQGCYDRVYCQAIECFQQSWANGGNGEGCCSYNTSARFCGSDCPLFCAEP
jgi:hypothetical protein